ncbi:putative ABC transporter permease protein YesQ [Lederbergia ruris]|uniref:ABC transporter permease protein YesQ n=1 Tax=Lederbergia ruris TaxID=217495 RepID=A0ABQ4KI59_9BACI|nr:carbohydrate ABC transporter permease [Lederbergia ruris]GIN56829.1 putative ABC transporter permease protein YesQ [Lederbergia ruris]
MRVKNIAPTEKTNAFTAKYSFSPHRIIGFIVLWGFLLSVVIFTIFPIVLAFLNSFKTNKEINLGETLLPKVWHLSNYIEAWQQANFSIFTWNSVYISIASTIGTLIVASLAAYAVDRIAFPGKKWFVFIQAATMFISIGAVVLRPQYDIMVSLGLNKSLWGVIIILIAGHATTFFLLLGFFRGVPKELDEAAMIDGCGYFKIYWRIILPLITPGLGVAGLFMFRQAWNEYILPLVFTMTTPELQPLTVGLANLRYGSSGDAAQMHLMLAGSCISILPILIVYVFANKSFMQMSAGSLKG